MMRIMKKISNLLDRPKFASKRLTVILLALAAIVPFSLIAAFAATPVDYSRDNCSIIFATGSPAADGVLKPGETFGASFSVYNGSPIVNGSSQELWPSASGPTPTDKRYKLVPSTGSNYDTTWTAGNPANVTPYTAELYGGANSSFGYLIGNVAGNDARTGLGNGTGYKAPATPGTYTFKFQLKQAGGSWHPTAICSKNLQVKNADPQPPVVRANPYICNKPYPAVMKLGVADSSAGRSDKCATAVQYALQASDPNLRVPALTGTIDASTVSIINNYKRFFGGANATPNGQLTAAELDPFQTVFGAFKTSTPGGGGGGGGGGGRGANPYVCNKPYPTVKSGYKNKADGRKDDCVSGVQYNLQAAVPSLQVTGTADAPTVAAIKNFQTFFKATADGVLTPAQVEGLATVFGPYKTDGTGGGNSGGSGGSGGGGGGSGKKLDIAIAGANFAGGSFDGTAKGMIQAIIGTAPYSTYKNDIAFHVVNVGGITCAPYGSTGDGRDVHCDYDQVAKVLAAKGVPYDKVLVVNNNTAWGGTAGGIGGQFATANLHPFIALHEFSHLMNLHDEYVYPGASYSPNTATYNCKDGKENKYWTSSDPQINGCTSSTWSRGSDINIMTTANASGFSAPAMRVLEETIKSYL